MMLSGDKGKLNDDQKEYVQEASMASRRMVSLVNSLLNVSRIEMGTFSIQPESIDIAAVIKPCIKEAEHKILEKGLTLNEEYEPTVPKVMADPKLLGIVIQNLLENAINYTPNEGKIKVSLKKRENDILITVEDTGIGIPENQKSKIFTKLFRADNAREKEANGNGLGLYMTKAIVDNSGGRIWFESPASPAKLGEPVGTAFYVAIPISGMKAKEGTKSLT